MYTSLNYRIYIYVKTNLVDYSVVYQSALQDLYLCERIFCGL